METAPEIIARKFLNRTNRHLFLTGRAGTGKTTFLRGIIGETHKKAVITAPTGVAAINAGGVTLHSLFQLPFGTFIPQDDIPFSDSISFEANTPRTLRRHMQMNATKRRLIQELELLIIDEVSMLRADILDAVDNVLRTVRRKGKLPFGGVQLLLIGDLLQLPPVVKDDEWEILKGFYKSIHFFEALALKGEAPLYLELEKIYRQSDPTFINLLNHLRDNEVTQDDVALLNRHYKPGFASGNTEGYIHLTTHNRIADKVNREELAKLSGRLKRFHSEVEKDFREHQYPLDPVLELKEGAQVMFIKNDPSGARRYFNGKIGTVSDLSGGEIEVGFEDGSDPVIVEKYIWLNKRYKLDGKDNEIKEEVLGSFTQYPLKLAWAVTVHKSQGLTFEKAIIDVEKAFAPGQIYVALSRLVSLDGLILSSPVPASGFVKDMHIATFAKTKAKEEDLDQILETETHKYIREKLIQYFDLNDLKNAFEYHLRSYDKDEKRSAKQRFKGKILDIQKQLIPEIEIAARFQRQVDEICRHPNEGYLVLLRQRVKSASEYFEPKIQALSAMILGVSEELSDAVGVKQYLKELRDLESHFFSKIQSIRKSLALVESTISKTDLTKDVFLNEEERQAREKLAVKSGKKGKAKKTGPKKKKGDTKKQSFDMLKSGMSIADIAKERGLTVGTIESHMINFIASGELDILELMDEEKVGEARKALREHYKDSLTPVIKALGKAYSFGELRWVLAAGKNERD